MESPVATLLAAYSGARAYFEPLAGNHGDRLIEMGSRLVLAGAGIELVADLERADVVVMNGGYGISDIYQVGMEYLARYGVGQPRTPLIVLPSSVTLADPTSLSRALARRSAPTMFYAREEYTLRTLSSIDFDAGVQIGLDHDMAFRLRGSAWLDAVRRTVANKHVLIVERTDDERVTTASRGQVFVPAGFIRALPSGVRRVLRRMRVNRHRARAVRTAFATGVQARVHANGLARLPTRAADISVPDVCEFDDFVASIAHAALVATNRLHVGILAAMLSKPTYLWPASTTKIRGVYEYSLRDYPNVDLVRD